MAIADVEHQEFLAKFRSAIRDCNLPFQGDTYLLKWLRARDFDVRKAELMLRNSLKWRETFGVDLLTDNWQPPEVLRQYYTVGFSGYDKERNPVWIFPLGRVDLPGFLRCTKKEGYVKYTVWIMERSLRLMQKQSASQHIIIFDLEGFSFRRFTSLAAMGMHLELTRIHEDNYPDTLKKCIVINASGAATIVYRTIKSFLSVKTSEKLALYDSSKENWVRELLQMIDPDQLPVHWGGTRTDPVDGNPYCSSEICLGGEIPQQYFEQDE